MKTSLIVLALALICASAPASSAVLAASDRPAVSVRQPTRAVLLAAGLAGPRVVALGERGIIILSDDQGQTWRQAKTPVSVTLTAVRFADSQRGFAVGHAGIVLVTQDGGETWKKCLDGISAAELVLAEARALAQRTPDAAAAESALKDAQRLVADGADKPWLDVLVIDANRIVVVGAYGQAMASDDGGVRWRPFGNRLPNPRALHLYAIRAEGSHWLIAGEQGLLLRSSDRGVSFSAIETPYNGSFFTAELLGGRGLLVAGLRGTALFSSDDGRSWRALEAPTPATYTSSARLGEDGVLLANQAGQVLAWRVAATAQPVLALTRAADLPTGLLLLGQGALLVVGQSGLRLVPASDFLEEGRRLLPRLP